ncbi:MAG: tryptophan synthase subunit alpha [Nitrospinaceae bacterium]|nr:tryptophan synthase subunit alpha [Nitrospinaceae bacterium]NIR53404.1 tryptophan synthase subunit alpha [Nitrospinaceae bacterium]NIS83808.1 tryptophan synthase subunit alpha [Nitrospinaceae bacterium]NIT80604.1 tryptophan synthase subunit alpha [Nitrospinaceae bacterium]NIU42928.1 tryptophan synthase subunit alpha [Nitrospinaceae bacterium]
MKRFDWLKSKSEKALVAFITAGDPDLDATRELFAVIEEGGADIIELGVPFSDPLADGPVIQASSQRSLKSGTTLKKIVQLVRDIRQKSQLPIVLMTSYNPVFVYGQEAFAKDAAEAGVDGVIIPDLPPEEAEEFDALAKAKGLDVIYLLAPTSTPERIEMIGAKSRGFIYYVSLTGVTGVRQSLAQGVAEKVARIKQSTALPVLIGFGISGPEQAKAAADCSDGVIVGSALVRMIEECRDPAERKEKLGTFVRHIKQALQDSK